MKRSILYVISLLTFLSAQDHASLAGSYYSNGVDARSISMGNAFIVSNDTYFPSYFNPAGVASQDARQGVFTHQFLTLDRHQSAIGVSVPLPPFGGISIGWLGSGVKDIQGRDLTGSKTDMLSSSEDMFIISFGVLPVEKLAIGGSVKILQSRIPNLEGNLSASGVGFDFGIIYNLNSSLSTALALQNINSAYQWSNKIDSDLGRVYKDKFPIQIRTGLKSQFTGLLVVGDIGAYISEGEYLDFNYRFGLEYDMDDKYFLRAGYRDNRVTFGIGLTQKQFNKIISNFDYALIIEPAGGLSNVITYAISF